MTAKLTNFNFIGALLFAIMLIVGLLAFSQVYAQIGPSDNGGNTGGGDDQNFPRDGSEGDNGQNFPRPPAEPQPSDDDDEGGRDDCDAKIGDRVWNDQNKNGVQDPGEPGISGVTVKSIDGNDKDYRSTDANGNYKFKDRCNKVTVIVDTRTLPEGCYQTYDRDGKLDHTYKRDLDEDESYKKADFGYHCPTKNVAKLSPQTGAGQINLGTIIGLLGAAAIGTYLLLTRRKV